MQLGGWWRLWILLAMAYGSVVVYFTAITFPSVETVQHQAEFLNLMSQDAQRFVLLGTQTDLKKQPWLKGAIAVGRSPDEAPTDYATILLNGGLEAIGDNLPLEMPNDYAFNLPRTLTNDQRELVAREYRRVLEIAASKLRLHSLQTAVFYWLVPMVVLLFLGLAVRWVVRGFTHDKSRAP